MGARGAGGAFLWLGFKRFVKGGKGSSGTGMMITTELNEIGLSYSRMVEGSKD